jgi:23S rRNA pseudouridine1911/1915/1917 synthase
LLVIAKTPAALKDLTAQLKQRTILREYLAIVYGKIISGGKVDAPIGRHAFQRKRMAVTDSGKPAMTHYRVAEKFRHLTLLKCRLETGRTHQIRVHMSYIHHPIVGDINYGGRVQLSKGMSEELITELRKFKRQALHAFALGFTHPKTGEDMHFEAEIPNDFKKLLTALKHDSHSA